MLEKMVASMNNNDSDCVFCRFKTFIIPEDKKKFYRGIEEVASSGSMSINYMFKYFAYGTMIWNKLFKRELIYKTDIDFHKFDEKLSIGEDEIWLIQVLKNANIVSYLSDELYYWRVRNNSAFRGSEISEKSITDVEAQYRAYNSLCNDDRYAIACELIEGRIIDKLYDFSSRAYMCGQKNFYDKLKEYRKKTVKIRYNSKTKSTRTKIKQSINYLYMDLKIHRLVK
jgi:hypothetical protein